jgi:hypothetical protein
MTYTPMSDYDRGCLAVALAFMAAVIAVLIVACVGLLAGKYGN